MSKKKRTFKSSRTSMIWSACRPWLVRVVVTGFVLGIGAVLYLDTSIRKQFEGGSWEIPAHVYTRPLDLYTGRAISVDDVLEELAELGYRSQTGAPEPGTYEYSGGGLTIHAREFQFWDQLRRARRIRIGFNPANNRITSVSSEGESLQLFQLEGRLFGSVSPVSHEDRELLTYEQVPQVLIDALIAIEDRNYYSHWGISLSGIARAAVANVVRGRIVQGGSTITQQLVKNYYLTAERTIPRKLVELVMAMLLELHYSKQQILLAYINEIYLGQHGNRAIHGFGLGAQFLFGRQLQELNEAELATLASMVKGPSYYNPLRHPARAVERRNLVLQVMQQQGFLTRIQSRQLQQLPLGTGSGLAGLRSSYPDFLGLVRQQLRKTYPDAALSTAGLRIYTTLDPRIQNAVEKSIIERLAVIEKARDIKPGALEAAAIVLRTDNGEVVALAGGRTPEYAGYNRALDAVRPVGSLLKPFVYLAALEQPEKYGLGTLIQDRPIVVSQRGSADWMPENHDGEQHGLVPLIEGLKNSYNLATVNLGMDVGLDRFAALLRRFKYQNSEPNPGPIYPSALLGAMPMTVSEVADLYLTLANSGFRMPTKSVRSVLSGTGEPVNRYPLSIEQVAEPEPVALIVYALQQIVMDGTARAIGARFGPDWGFAGKTGTTDGYRDSWYAGFSGDYLMVVWVGRDNNQYTGLSGASGAAQIWSDTFANIAPRPLILENSTGINFVAVDLETGLQTREHCRKAIMLPYIADYEPAYQKGCDATPEPAMIGNQRETDTSINTNKGFGEWLKGLFD